MIVNYFLILFSLIAGDTKFSEVINTEIEKAEQLLSSERYFREVAYEDPIIYVCKNNKEFYERTGISPSRGGVYVNDTIYLIPVQKLISSNSLYIIRHEYVHHIFSQFNFPEWIDEGLAVIFGGPYIKLYPFFNKEEIEEKLNSESEDTLRMGYSSSGYYVKKEIKKYNFEQFIQNYRRTK